MIYVYNTLTRRKEELKPMQDGRLKMYVCGPTVYDVPHIGHARSAFVFDVIRRYFEYKGLEVYFVRNVTDIDDKIINRAVKDLEELGGGITSMRLKERVKDVAERYLRDYHVQLDVFGIRPPSAEPKATENIPQMIKFIAVLIEKGYAYRSGGSVYFSVEKFDGYGKLSHQAKEEMLHGVRIESDAGKKYPLDFALWKKAGENEPFWESPWGKGRPGWHIECSAMSTEMLGNNFDIHGGGLDLIFPHHENEIAQAEAATGTTFANYWIHNGLLTVSGEKMSKSLGNFTTIADFLDKYKDPDLLKIAFLHSNYRSPMDYSEVKMREAARIKERIMIFFDKTERLMKECGSSSPETGADALAKAQWTVGSLMEKFDEAMADDINTPVAMAVMFEAIKIANDSLADEKADIREKARTAFAIKNFVIRCANIMGLRLSPVKIASDMLEEVDALVRAREEARKAKDYAKSDVIRKELLAKGIVVEDTPEGPVWRKK